jgi:hypothetical protein
LWRGLRRSEENETNALCHVDAVADLQAGADRFEKSEPSRRALLVDGDSEAGEGMKLLEEWVFGGE